MANKNVCMYCDEPLRWMLGRWWHHVASVLAGRDCGLKPDPYPPCYGEQPGHPQNRAEWDCPNCDVEGSCAEQTRHNRRTCNGK